MRNADHTAGVEATRATEVGRGSRLEAAFDAFGSAFIVSLLVNLSCQPFWARRQIATALNNTVKPRAPAPAMNTGSNWNFSTPAACIAS
ncbi:MAG: hypothetical protein K0Q92_2768 [Steroidobacteraceae bacterium]|nr:hypothetical protein [Steroidobacteraceae bacterium]